MNKRKIRVLIVEDSLVVQKLLKGIISGNNEFELVGIAENGIQANDFVLKYKPDVVSMDLQMPYMDGVEACRKIMQENPVPVVIVSSLYQPSEIETAIKVLEAGAVTILPRPFGPGHSKYLQTAKHYLNTLKLMSEVKVIKRKNLNKIDNIQNRITTNKITKNNLYKNDFKIITIGASAGGPQSINTILSGLQENFPLPILLVQHIDSHFIEGFASWLNMNSKLPVIIVNQDLKLQSGNVYIPCKNHHLILKNNEVVSVSEEKSMKGICPSVDLLFKSVGDVYGKNSIAILLSGMGKDGAVELKRLYDLGAYTIAQDEESCLVFGMPGEAFKLGGVHRLLSPENIIKEINDLIFT